MANTINDLPQMQYPAGNGVCNGTDVAVKSNTADLANAGYFKVLTDGNVKFDPIIGAAGQTRAFVAGDISEFRVKRIYDTGTTVTGDIYIFY